jgi:Uma2 family endonuclease
MTTAMPSGPDIDALLDWERAQPERHEYVGGIMRMMVGARIGHSRVVADLALAIRRRLASDGCEVFQESVKVRTRTAFLYPDVFVTCEPLDLEADLVTAPILIAEVLSPSTAERDRGAKWQEYKAIDSLRAYLLVAADRPSIDLYRRDGAGWRCDTATGTAAMLDLPGLVEPLPLAEVWARIPLDP